MAFFITILDILLCSLQVPFWCSWKLDRRLANTNMEGTSNWEIEIIISWCVKMWGSAISAWFLSVSTTIQCLPVVLLTQVNRELYTIISKGLYTQNYILIPPLMLYRVGKHYWFIPIWTLDYAILGAYEYIWGTEYLTIELI